MRFAITFLILFFAAATVVEAQLRDDLRPSDNYTGVLSHTNSDNTSAGSLMNMLNMSMTHSYSMSFSNFGGQMQNINAYTNTMNFDLTDNLDASVSMSLLHSPFGNSFMNTGNDLGSRIILDSARLDYRLSDRSSISFEFSQRPYYYSPYGNFGPHSHGSMFNRNPYWY